jgi:uncharacterized membrane protein
MGKFSFFKRFYRFLARQSFFPLVMATLLALAIFSGRVLISRSIEFRLLVWNLFLAWLPYGFSMVAAGLHRLFPRRWGLLLAPGLAWLAFFPNAPYLVTDLYHLEYRPPVPMWFDIGMISIYAITGFFLAAVSLRTMQILVKVYLGRWLSWAFALATIGLGGLGIYLGRFVRVNSWDLLFNPFQIARELAAPVLDPLNNLRFFGFTLMFTAILLVFYLMFVSVSRAEE